MKSKAEKISRYDVRQFRPAIYWLVLLGISGFAFAAESPAVWVLALGAVGVHAWLAGTDRFRPIPRIIANAVTVLGVIILGVALQQNEGSPLLLIGHFLVLLQMVKLFEQRANRDYAQLLVLSLLLMVAAAINTASLAFGIILVLYLFLALYCCLLFHLKTEEEYARQMSGFGKAQTPLRATIDDQAQFDRSMRRIIAAISGAALLCAGITFFLFPRGSGATLFGQSQFRPSQSLTVFHDSVSFQNVARITQNNEEVAKVVVSRMGQPFQGILLLRGITLDTYTGNGKGEGNSSSSTDPHEWKRIIPDGAKSRVTRGNARNRWAVLSGEESDGVIHQQITLSPTGTNTLFALAGVVAFRQENGREYNYTPYDEVLQTDDVLTQKIRYEVTSRGELNQGRIQDYSTKLNSQIDPQIEVIARQVEVSGLDDDDGQSLAAKRPKAAAVTKYDSQIAKNIETYLRSNFTYTLDLTDAAKIGNKDPMLAFLTDFKRGHCEYFAGAMTLLCQSLGMHARVVAGFKCDEYNTIGDYYTVRQSHAHTWVEVLNSDNIWEVFDPTSSTEEVSVRMDTVWQRLRAIFNYLEYQWEDAVIAFDQTRRNNVLASLDRQSRLLIGQAAQTIRQAWHWEGKVFVSLNIITALIVLFLGTLAFAVMRFFWEKSRLRRRARRIGLDALPLSEQLKLARQLRFYDEMILLLERYSILRPVQLTPMEFSNSLTYLPVEAFDSIQRLTDIYYHVRYGRAELSELQQRQLVHAIVKVENTLGRVF